MIYMKRYSFFWSMLFFSAVLLLPIGTLTPEVDAAGPSGVSVVNEEECYGPDCEWYQKLLNTLEEAEDKAYASKACMERVLELERINRDALTYEGELTEAQIGRTLLAWKVAKGLRVISKSAWDGWA